MAAETLHEFLHPESLHYAMKALKHYEFIHPENLEKSCQTI